MNIKQIERKFETLGYWLLKNKNGLFHIQDMTSGEIYEEELNLETLENKLERLETVQEI